MSGGEWDIAPLGSKKKKKKQRGFIRFSLLDVGL